MSGWITAATLARDAGVSPARFRRELQLAEERGEITWHRRGTHWQARVGSPEYDDLNRVLTDLINADTARERLRGR